VLAGNLRLRIAVAIAAALLVAVLGIVWPLAAVIDARAREGVERDMARQAEAVALAVARDGPRAASEAARFLVGTRMVVRRDGLVVYWNEPVGNLAARAAARAGDVEVTLERPDPLNRIDGWLVAGVVALGALAAVALVWLVSGRLARRLRRALAELSGSVRRVAEGDLSVRAPAGDDELGRLAEAFNRMTGRLEAADAGQRAFLADVAHELRTPVTAIEGFAAALGDGTAGTPEERAEATAFIREEAARLGVLIADLRQLTLLHVEPVLDTRPVDLGELARSAVARFAPEAREREVRLSGPDERVGASADPVHVGTILANLVGNALRHTPAGGEVRVRVGRAGREAWLAVEDTGRGISAEHLPHVFDRLYRVEAARERDGGGGSGLGLAIVRRLAVLHGGRAEARSEPGRGSVFTVWLPGATPPAPSRGRAAGDEVGAGR
jgi:signal transduction histidine kinase